MQFLLLWAILCSLNLWQFWGDFLVFWFLLTVLHFNHGTFRLQIKCSIDGVAAWHFVFIFDFYTVFALMGFGLSLYSVLCRNHPQFIFQVASFPMVCSVGWDGGLPCADVVYHIYFFPLYQISHPRLHRIPYDDGLCWLTVPAHISCHIFKHSQGKRRTQE